MADQDDIGKLRFWREADGSGQLRMGDWGPPKPRLQDGLLFRRPADGSGKLVFGYTVNPGTVVTPGADVAIVAGFAGDMRARIGIALPVGLGIHATFANDMVCRIEAHYDANVDRGLLARANPGWQDAQPRSGATRSSWQDTDPVTRSTRTAWQRARSAVPSTRVAWQASHELSRGVRSDWQRAQRATNAFRAAFQEALARRTGVRQLWQLGQPLTTLERLAYQETLKLHAGGRSRWQRAQPRTGWWALHNLPARPLHTAWRPRWQEAMLPLPGGTVRPRPPDPERDLCYCPETLGQLVFRAPYTGDGRLLFVCRPCPRDPGEPDPPAHVVVARRRSYIVINSIELRRADDLSGPPLPSEAFYMALDAGSWTWTWEATFHRDARAAVTPAAGETIEIEARVNGQPFRLQIERSGRSARFPERLVTAAGRGRAAVLDAPHSPVQSFGNDSQRSAQQLMEEVLTINGVGFGWSVDFQLTDWIVPGGVWGHHGTFASALSEIAAAAGGYLQPHDTDNVLHVLPRWPLPWWRWAGEAEPDIELPAGFAEMEATELVVKPEANRIILHGHAGGVQGDYKREGSAGDILREPMVTHPLITDASVAYQRAIAELADTGRIINQTLTTMVLPEIGIIKPGTMLRYVDDDDVARLGLVRSTAINWQFPVLTQTIGIESHA